MQEVEAKRILLKGGLEYDVLTPWRKVYCYTKKPRICKFAKRKYNKRFRSAVKTGLREQFMAKAN